MRNGSAIANGIRQYAVTNIGNAAWVQLESMTGNSVAANGSASAPVRRWPGQMSNGAASYDYVQGILLQNKDAAADLFVTTSEEGTGAAPTSRTTANSITIKAGGSFKLDNTDATKVYLRSSAGTITVAVLAT